jgi:hypothetical protein
MPKNIKKLNYFVKLFFLPLKSIYKNHTKNVKNNNLRSGWLLLAVKRLFWTSGLFGTSGFFYSDHILL